MAEGDLLDAREAMQILGINENELQTLVARGDLRAFRSAGTMKFRRDDVGSLKSEKGTEPTIIIPAAGAKKTGGSGILPALGSPAKPPSRIASAVHPATPPGEQTGEIVLEDIELMPTDMDAAGTQQVTIQTGVQTGHQTGIGGQTVIESGQTSGVTSGVITGQMTVMEDAPNVATGSATAVGSGRRQAPPLTGAPAIGGQSRVARAPANQGVSMATSRRTAAVYQPKPAHPFMTAIMIVNTVLFAFTASIAAVMMTRGHYDQASQQRIIPPFLNHGSSTPVYRWMYKNSPGDPQDKKPLGEFDGEIKGNG